jgi:hypothetical protein
VMKPVTFLILVFAGQPDVPIFKELNMLGDKTCDISHPRVRIPIFKELNMLGDETCDISHPRIHIRPCLFGGQTVTQPAPGPASRTSSMLASRRTHEIESLSMQI